MYFKKSFERQVKFRQLQKRNQENGDDQFKNQFMMEKPDS